VYVRRHTSSFGHLTYKNNLESDFVEEIKKKEKMERKEIRKETTDHKGER
jgi:hypothetical protein